MIGKKSLPGIVVVAVTACFSVACGVENSADPAPGPSSAALTVTSTRVVPGCTYDQRGDSRSADEERLGAAILELNFPVNVCLFSVAVSDSLDMPGMSWVTIALEAPESKSPNDLRSIATDIAQVVKKTDIGARTAILDITNGGAPPPSYPELLTDEEFQQHSWNGTPSEEADRAIWKVVSQ